MANPRIVIGPHGYVDAADHWNAMTDPEAVAPKSVVWFYFDALTWVDVKFAKDVHGEDCLEVRTMSATFLSLSVQPASGNTLYIKPGP